MLDLKDSLYEGFLTSERNLENMRDGCFWYNSLLFVETCFSGLLSVSVVSVCHTSTLPLQPPTQVFFFCSVEYTYTICAVQKYIKWKMKER